MGESDEGIRGRSHDSRPDPSSIHWSGVFPPLLQTNGSCGHNGMGAMRGRPTVDQWAKKMVDAYAERGTCVRRQAGSLALDDQGRIVGVGMNGVPRGFVHCIEQACGGEKDTPGNTDRCMAVHAEANMILNSIAPDRIVRVYVSASPCKGCALLLANLPRIREVLYWEEYADDRGLSILVQRGVRVTPLAERAPTS